MMKSLFLTIILLLSVFPFLQAQESEPDVAEVMVSGKYTGENVYVLNPSENELFSVQNVLVNGKEYAFNHQSNAFEINLSSHQLNDFIYIQIQYKSAEPKVVNAESLIQESEFSLPSFIYNKKTKMLDWKIEDMSKECDYQLQQFLYGKWVKVKNLGRPDEMISNNFLPVLITGMNLFRIVQDDGSRELSSPIVKIKSPNRKIMLMSDKVKDFIEFSGVTHYELYDVNGFFIKRGTAQKVNVADLKKGAYWINFDGKETMIDKK